MNYIYIMIRTYQYRLYPTKSQEQTMLNNLFLCRHLYNTSLEQRISAYKTKQITISCYDQYNENADCFYLLK